MDVDLKKPRLIFLDCGLLDKRSSKIRWISPSCFFVVHLSDHQSVGRVTWTKEARPAVLEDLSPPVAATLI